LALDDKYVDAYIGLGGDYYEKGTFDREVTNYLKAAQLDPQDANSFYLLGTAYEDIGKFADASAPYEKALTLEPNFKDALHDLSIVYLAEGKTGKARELLPKLASVDNGWGQEVERLLARIR
jgi:Flp pilus assembly protein TadD